MFPVEALPAHYYEERAAEHAQQLALEQAKRRAQQQQPSASTCSTTRTATLPSHHQHPTIPPHTALANTLPAPISRQAVPANGVLANIFQGLVRSRATPISSCTSSNIPSRAQTPLQGYLLSEAEKDRLRQEEALRLEKERDTGICTLPGWH